MHTKDKINEMISELQVLLDNEEFEEALTLLCMIKNVEQLSDWMD